MKHKYKIIILLSTLIVIFLIIYILYYLNYIPHKKYTNEDFNIITYISDKDKDNDGIDDQTDILNSVREYISKKPVYKSKYYATGYPDDNYGVCTDVVAFGLLGAGYDIMNLLNEDVLNLKTYLDNNSISLTTNIYEIESWQGGDIVVFKTHIGIVSDKRNKNGVSFIIHHANPYQKYYEEDIIEHKTDLIRHYRIS